MPEQADRPGRLGYWTALALLAVGLALFVAAVVPAMRAVSAGVEGLQRVALWGASPAAEFRLETPGEVHFFYEPVTTVGPQAFATETTWEPELALERLEPGEPAAWVGVELVPTQSTIVYRTDGRAGHSLVSASAPSAGRYRLEVVEPGRAGNVAEGTIGPAAERPRVIAIGTVPVQRLKDGFVGVYGGAVALGLLGCAAAVLALITWARRHGTRTGRLDGQPTAWA
ncbi:hypothetical protein [Phycisphaera mikurensis]|uniref:Uncharacterized protein n=1 Tax=Phycisphaera mikurensis (strain NBRC 102666 / KCTC 22515 / FYK2301M01) TaxID=1142394 RepID=I0IG97_PHYMF|nr:hypothetical protein [Phycisphaera mikurensis]MBB6440333.1 hypothetical protein [Phycisphaera mikurensis]BAM04285.1 hypothetical protein PSMK_21260 [Phycisphaera mikurensis NBRC 102666]